MNRCITKILLGLILVFLLIQMIQPARNIDYGQVPSTDIAKVYQIPENVQTVFANSCYDCHSNSTDYPFYAYIQPLSFFIDNHIKEGKKELNFNEWGNYSHRRQANKLESIANQIKQQKMPLPSYAYLHRGANLSKKQIEEIVSWVELMQAENEKVK
ncbi:cytochrome C [Chryseobacterium sp. Tr-659]|uniref:heme-binding domain-containing protein n=1 Tax=Chryseobacterium sp. Tr-659 TaxID=2608340 RepID=UPI00142417A7|nr:heme-binding domain-containing protein [Chryseobacterium sp. Tr-659]NIF05072.1 cytochrome C [Chryseobacterium sp. Tr-659]